MNLIFFAAIAVAAFRFPVRSHGFNAATAFACIMFFQSAISPQFDAFLYYTSDALLCGLLGAVIMFTMPATPAVRAVAYGCLASVLCDAVGLLAWAVYIKRWFYNTVCYLVYGSILYALIGGTLERSHGAHGRWHFAATAFRLREFVTHCARLAPKKVGR